MKIARSPRWLLGLVLLLVQAPAVSACPNCKEAVANQDDDAARLADGYSYSILVMMAMPFTLLGAGGYLVARAARNGAFPEL